MKWQEYCVPIGYSPLAQIIVAFVLGLIFSYFSTALVVIVFFLILYEAAWFGLAAGHDFNRWTFLSRVGVVFAYIAGWFIARAILDLDSCYFSKKRDSRLGLKMATSRR